MSHYSKGRIRAIWKHVDPGTLIQGADASYCRDGYGCSGGNGSYRLWDGQIYLYVTVKVYADDRWYEIDIRDEVLERTGWSRLTKGRVQALNRANRGLKVTLVSNSPCEWEFADFDEFDFDV